MDSANSGLAAPAPRRFAGGRRWWPIALVLLVVAVAAWPDKTAGLVRFLEWVRSLGPAGMVLFGVVYVVAALAFVPGSILTMAAGFLFGFVRGTLLVSLAATVAAVVAFWLGRSVARGWIEARVARRPRFRALDEAVAEEGFRIVLLTRLSPVFPFNVLNYAYGLTRVRLRDYALASWIGMLPGTALYVYVGSAARSAAEIAGGTAGPGGPARTAALVVGLVATLGVTVVVTRIARRALARRVPGAEGGATAGEHDRA